MEVEDVVDKCGRGKEVRITMGKELEWSGTIKL